MKRVQRKHDGSLVLISDNHAYQPDTVDKEAAKASWSSAAWSGPAARSDQADDGVDWDGNARALAAPDLG